MKGKITASFCKIYGLVQAARLYNRKAIEIMKMIGFTGGNVDLCLNIKQSTKGRVYIAF